MSRLPEPSPPDYCGGCDRDRPLYLLEGTDGARMRRCRDCLRDALANDDQVPAATRENGAQLQAERSDPRPTGHDPRVEPINWLTASLYELAGAAGGQEEMLANGLTALAELERRLGETAASLRIAEEVVVRQKALLETGTEMIEEARRWARSLWDDGPAAEEPVVLNEPEFAPAWLTADGPRHSAPRPPGTPGGVDPVMASHELQLAALDRWLADVEAEWGPITAEEMATAAQRLRDRARPQG